MTFPTEGLIVTVKKLLYLFHGKMVRSLEGSHASSQNVRYYSVFQIFEILHVQYQTLFFGKGQQGLLQLHLCFISIEVGSVRERLRQVRGTLIVQRYILFLLFLIQKGNAFVGGDAIQPGIEL